MTPIRFITGNMESKYFHINKEVEALHMLLKGKMQESICVDPDLALFYGPKVLMAKNQIIVSERFLNFLWAFIYFAFTYQEKANELLTKNSQATVLPMTSPELKSALELLKYAKQLTRGAFLPWPNGIISPGFNGSPSNDVEDFALKTNGLFSTATTCFFLHELAHVYLDHREEAQLQADLKARMMKDPRFEATQGMVAPIIASETAADNFTIDYLIRQYDDDKIKLNNAYGVICAYVSLTFSVRSLGGMKQIFHPNLHDRVLRVVQRIDESGLKESGYFAHFASQTLMLLLDQAGVALASYDAGRDEYAFLLQVMEEIDKRI